MYQKLLQCGVVCNICAQRSGSLRVASLTATEVFSMWGLRKGLDARADDWQSFSAWSQFGAAIFCWESSCEVGWSPVGFDPMGEGLTRFWRFQVSPWFRQWSEPLTRVEKPCFGTAARWRGPAGVDEPVLVFFRQAIHNAKSPSANLRLQNQWASPGGHLQLAHLHLEQPKTRASTYPCKPGEANPGSTPLCRWSLSPLTLRSVWERSDWGAER